MDRQAWNDIDDTVALVLSASARLSPDQPCLGDWSVRDTLSHLSAGLALHSALLDGSPSPVDLDASDAYAERGIAERADHSMAAIAAEINSLYPPFRDRAQATPPEQLISWHSGICLTARSVTALALAELLVHTFDIVILSRRYRPPRDASREVLWALEPVLPVISRSQAPSYRMLLRTTDNPLRASRERPDFTIRVNPDAALLFAYRRLGLVGLAIHGRPTIAGRRPWRALRLVSARPR